MSGENNKNYQLKGVKLSTSDRASWKKEELPEWRMVHTTVILPIPSGVLGDLKGFRDDPRWLEGRFNGVKSVDIPILDEEKGKYRLVTKEENEDNGFKYTPRTFHSAARNRFSSSLAESVKANASESIAKNRQPSLSQEGKEEDRSAFFRYQFIHDFTNEPWVEDKAEDFIPDYKEELQFEYSVDFSTKYKNYNNILSHVKDKEAKVSLVGMEILRFDDGEVHDLKKRESARLDHDFLVLHVISEYCSSELASAIIASLNRPRNEVKIVFKDSSDSTGGMKDKSLLKYFIELVNEKIPKSCVQNTKDSREPFVLSPGGFIESSSSGKALCRPYRVTCAIPARPIREFPLVLSPEEGDENDSWGSVDAWAWVMSTAPDRYYSGFPSLDKCSLSESQIADYRYWTVHASTDGMAVVRKKEDLSYDMNPCMMTSTRYVDLVLLTLRSRAYLEYMNKQLRNVEFNTEGIKKVLEEMESLEKNDSKERNIFELNSKLRSYVDAFENIQSDLVYFRDKLWFEGSLTRSFDAKILSGVQKSMGAYNLFEDIKSELSLRKSVYDAQKQSINILLKDHQERIRIRKEKEEHNHREKEEKKRQGMNNIFAIIATVLALPGLVALWPDGSSVKHFYITILLCVLVSSVLIFILKKVDEDS